MDDYDGVVPVDDQQSIPTTTGDGLEPLLYCDCQSSNSEKNRVWETESSPWTFRATS